MADISSSAAKQHVLGGAGEVQRMSGEAVKVARELGHSYLGQLGRLASAHALKDRRKTIMPQDLHAAANSIRGGAAGASSAPTFS